MIDVHKLTAAMDGMGLSQRGSYVPPSSNLPEAATREGQREIVAAVLAAAMIAAEGRMVTAVEAVERWKAMLAALVTSD